jgi:hypothetical protein
VGVAAADELVRQSLGRTAEVISLADARGRRAARQLLELLEAQDRRLSTILRREAARYGGGTARFTGAAAEAYRAQIRLMTTYVRGRLQGLTAEQAAMAVDRGLGDTIRLLEGLERRFTGIVVPLQMRQAAILDPLRNGIRASLLRQHLTSVDRYGEAMIGQFERTMRAGMMSGASQDDMIGALTGHGGPRGRVSMRATVSADGTVIRLVEQDIPEGLFRRHRYWAERIVRTETAHAYQEARIQGLYETRRRDMPDMQKKILAHFDNRTAPDSIAVHGQVRKLEDYFIDGAGRQYLRPPARPNDRETVVPWRPHWSETATTRERSPEEQRQALEENVRQGAQRRAGVA